MAIELSSTKSLLSDRSFLILYATLTGTALDTSERIARKARSLNWKVKVKNFSQFCQADLLTLPLIVFVLPTTGNGTAPPELTSLWNSLLHPDLPGDLLEDLSFAVFALGDSSYPKFNWTGRKMFRRLEGLGAHSVVERGEGDDQNEWGIESTFPKWLSQFLDAIEKLSPLSTITSSSHSSNASSPKIPMKSLSLFPDSTIPSTSTPSTSNLPPPPRLRLDPVSSSTSTSVQSSSSEANAHQKWAKDVEWVTVKSNTRVTDSNWFQDVRGLELEFDVKKIESQERYRAGDVLEIKPCNSPEVVQEFLNSIGWQDVADVEYLVSATSDDQPLPPHLPFFHHTTIRSLLTYELDITSVPRLSFFEFLSYFPSSSQQSTLDLQEKLQWFCTGAGQDDLIDYTIRPKRTIVEVIKEFKSGLKVPVEYVMDLIPLLRSRGFSIASSSQAHDGEVHLLVAIVGYKTILSIPRKGVCTSYISKLNQGDKLQVRFEKGLLKLPPPILLPIEAKQNGSNGIVKQKIAAPLILIGPGTGVAPFRALMEERIKEGSRENLLFFGCRKESKDFYYRSEWEKMVQDGYLNLFVAASRDQEDKIYVQHRIAEQSKLVWDYLTRGGYLYICGSSTQMPKSVKKAILAIFEKEGGLIGVEGEKKWEELEKGGRILEETWG